MGSVPWSICFSAHWFHCCGFHSIITITSLLASHPYVIVSAVELPDEFDSVRHSSVLNTYSGMNLHDNIYNWIENFFRDHSHCMRFGDKVSNIKMILASTRRGSGLCPASYTLWQHHTYIQKHLVTPSWVSWVLDVPNTAYVAKNAIRKHGLSCIRRRIQHLINVISLYV